MDGLGPGGWAGWTSHAVGRGEEASNTFREGPSLTTFSHLLLPCLQLIASDPCLNLVLN